MNTNDSILLLIVIIAAIITAIRMIHDHFFEKSLIYETVPVTGRVIKKKLHPRYSDKYEISVALDQVVAGVNGYTWNEPQNGIVTGKLEEGDIIDCEITLKSNPKTNAVVRNDLTKAEKSPT